MPNPASKLSRVSQSPIAKEPSTDIADIRLSQTIHASAIIFIPFIGCALSIWVIGRWGIHPLNIWLFGLFYFLTMVLGVTVGFHRLLAHRSFQSTSWVKALLVIFGCMAAQGPPAYWVSNHRRHHQFSDREEDPHSPHCNAKGPLNKLQGFMHSHFYWMFTHKLTSTTQYAKDLLRDPIVMAIGRYYLLWVYLGLIFPPLIMWVTTFSVQQTIVAFLLSGLTRLFFTFHATSSVNSICHMFGQRDFSTKENSRNNLILSLPTGGESWHNNHHAFPYSARFGIQWWQLDIGYISIWILERLGLAWSVKTAKQPTPKHLET